MDDKVTALAKMEKQRGELAEIEQPPENLLTVIARAVRDPLVDVEKMERLFAMHERVQAEQRRTEFFAALSRLQAKLPQIDKRGKIEVSGTVRSRYSKIEDIDLAIKPFLTEEGFAFSFDTKPNGEKGLLVFARLSHAAGHYEEKSLPLPIDYSQFRSNIQSVKSSLSYGRRCLIEMHLNLIEKDADDDGQGGAKPITKEQAAKLHSELAALKVNEVIFLRYMAADKLESILARDWQKVTNFMEAKRRDMEGKNANSS